MKKTIYSNYPPLSTWQYILKNSLNLWDYFKINFSNSVFTIFNISLNWNNLWNRYYLYQSTHLGRFYLYRHTLICNYALGRQPVETTQNYPEIKVFGICYRKYLERYTLDFSIIFVFLFIMKRLIILFRHKFQF